MPPKKPAQPSAEPKRQPKMPEDLRKAVNEILERANTYQRTLFVKALTDYFDSDEIVLVLRAMDEAGID